jgi:hypothetical protein
MNKRIFLCQLAKPFHSIHSPFEQVDNLIFGIFSDKIFAHFIVDVDEKTNGAHNCPTFPGDWGTAKELVEP